MKKSLFILFAAVFLSCSDKEEPSVEPNLIGEWVLVQTEGQFAGSKQTGSEMPFQETYVLQNDGSFTKTRLKDGEEIKATGTFEVTETSEFLHVEEAIASVFFHHNTQNPLIATCYSSSLTEELYLTTGGELISLHHTCDGLGLQYEQIILD